MKPWGQTFNRFVSATLVASLLSAAPVMAVPSLAFADEAPVSCKTVHLLDFLKPKKALEAPRTEKPRDTVAPVTRGLSNVWLHATYAAFSRLGKVREFNDAEFQDAYNRVKNAVAHNENVEIEKFQTASALLGAFEAVVERARAESAIYKGGFSFKTMYDNASEAQRDLILKRLEKAVDPKGYKSWRTGDVLAELYLLHVGPYDTFQFAYGPGRIFPQAVKDIIRLRLEVQMIRGEWNKVAEEVGLGRPDKSVIDSLQKTWLIARKFGSSIAWTGLIIYGYATGIATATAGAKGLHGLISSTASTALGVSATMKIGDMVNTRKPLDPLTLAQLKAGKDFNEIWPDISKRDKFLAARQIDLKVLRAASMRIISAVLLFYALSSVWNEWLRPKLRERFPKLIDALSLPTGSMSTAELKQHVFDEWHDSMLPIYPDLDKMPNAIADERRLIDEASRAQLEESVYHNGVISDAGMKNQVSAEKAAADLKSPTVDEDSDDPTANFPPIP